MKELDKLVENYFAEKKAPELGMDMLLEMVEQALEFKPQPGIYYQNPETGKLEETPIVMDFASSKLRISRNWNSQIALKGGDRFAGLWKIKSVAVENRMGNAFMNLDVDFEGWAQEEDYKKAESLYEQHSK